MRNFFLVIILATLFSCHSNEEFKRDKIDLIGSWQFTLDTANVGLAQQWYMTDLSDSVNIPGTTDENKKGFFNTDTSTMHLHRMYKYEGVAWYRKKIFIPEKFQDKYISLFIERTRSTTIWVDSTFIGGSKLLQSPQQFDLSGYLTPGEHIITVRVDNSLKITPFGNVHIYSDDTQTNWNGMLGEVFIEAASRTHITDLQVRPDVKLKKIKIRLGLENKLAIQKADIEIRVEKKENGRSKKLKSTRISKTLSSVMDLEYDLGDEFSFWNERNPTIYTVTVNIIHGEIKDSKTVSLGMREFSKKGTQFSINGKTIFLRGKHEAAVFPLTGYPPMNVEEWKKVYEIAKSYGINHYRFHSYCPPEAAFTAADQAGIYIQAELPFWGGLESDTIANMLLEEGKAMLRSYANHPSFVLFSPGNEIWSGHDRVEKNMIALKEYDDRLLYTMGSNNNIGYTTPKPYVDFFVGARTPYAFDTTLTHTRLTHCFADSRNGGMLNTITPTTELNYDFAVSQMQMPVVSHEVGQYQVYPNYEEIKKYTGVLRASNLEIFKKRLERSGMADQDKDFQKASGAWAALCYKAEMEAALRTNGLAGFQLLDLQDFPGQGTALVGILDAFMESKKVVSREEWLQSCNDLVLLLEFPKYCWTKNESFHANVKVANYSGNSIEKNIHWELRDQAGTVIRKDILQATQISDGGNSTVGKINFTLSDLKVPEKYSVKIFLPGTSYANEYPLWVYDTSTAVQVPKEIKVSGKLDNYLIRELMEGSSVLLFPPQQEIKDKSVPGHFPPDFWNYGMFKGISEWTKKPVSPGTLGILTRPEHPIFNSFPTDFHTNWQWFSILKESNSLFLDNTSSGYRPIVQVIDNLERNHKLGLIFEFKVGKGKLLVCMSRLPELSHRPEAIQLYRSILNYMASPTFDPGYRITEKELMEMF